MATHLKTYLDVSQTKDVSLEQADLDSLQCLFFGLDLLKRNIRDLDPDAKHSAPIEALIDSVMFVANCADDLQELREIVEGKRANEWEGIIATPGSEIFIKPELLSPKRKE